MAARKLAAEIERTLKKVGEGVEQFESLYEKMQASQNQTQKEKMESDLKTQIKKLQRLRDQIKTWQQSNDIKDKKALVDNRKLIETQMERFKACEKEMKTKAFSKEGLIAAARLDPAEKAKVEMCNWITSQVDELSRQIESSEAEIEQLQAGGGKKKKASSGATAERAATLETLNERRSWHSSRLEILHRMIENGQLEPERVTDIKEDVVYFVESNGEEEFEEDDGIYDEFDLDEQEEAYGLKADDEAQSSHDGVSVADEQSATPPPPPKATVAKESKRRDSEHDASAASAAAAAAVAPSASSSKKEERKGSTSNAPSRKASDTLSKPPSDTKAPPVPPVNFAAAKQSPVASSAAPVTSPQKPTSAATTLPPIRYAAAAAAAVGSTTNAGAAPGSTATAPSPVSTTQDLANADSVSSAPTNTVDTSASPAPSHAPSQQTSLSGEGESAGSGPAAPPGLARTQSPAVNGSAKVSPSLTHASVSEQAVGAGSRVDGSRADSPSVASSSHQGPFQSTTSSVIGQAGAMSNKGGPSASEARLPSSLADLATSFESAKMKSLNRSDNLSSVHKSLESSFMNVPEPLDSEKPKYYVPQNLYPTPAYYPQNPSSIFDNPTVYGKFDEDTLFYIFYYQQGTYHQFLAARELKRQSWRFHKQFLTWFRRHSEPQAITDEYEQGVYVYFDWEGSWAQRKKSDFRFEYRWLED